MTDWIAATFNLEQQLRKNLTGYSRHADTLFAARFVRN